MKILVLTSQFPHSGRLSEGRFIFESVKALDQQAGVEVKVIAPVFVAPWERCKISSFENIFGLEVWHPCVPTVPFLTRWINGFVYAAAVKPLIQKLRKQFTFDLIAAHFLYPDGFAAVRLGRTFRIPVVVKALGSDVHQIRQASLKYWLTKWVLRNADRVICVSQDIKKRIRAWMGQDFPVEVISNGVNLEEKGQGAETICPEAFGLKTGKPLLLNVGRFVALKNQDFLIDLMSLLPAEYQLVLIGSGPQRGRYEKKVRAKQLQGRVKLLGPLEPADIQGWMKAASVLLHPSLAEGIPNVVLEALAGGLPVIAAPVGGVPEVISDGNNGFLCKPDDRPMWIKRIKEVLEDHEQTQRICAEGVRILRERGWDWNAATQRLAAVFRDILKEKEPVHS